MTPDARSVSRPDLGPSLEALELDHNERPWPAPELAGRLAGVPEPALSRYPDATGLARRAARRWSVDEGGVLVTAGGDDALDRVCRVFLRERPELVSVDPTFEMIPRFARLAGGRVVAIPHLGGPAPVDVLLRAVGPRTGLVAVVSPHNPTGAATPAALLAELADALPAPVRLLVDLAYVEFAREDPTAMLLERPRTIVVRTLSKAWGLAGLRVGFALGGTPDIRMLAASGAPFPVAGPSLWLAEAALDAGDGIPAPHVDAVRRERAELTALLRALGAAPFPSEANFVLSRVERAACIRERLGSRGIRVRTFVRHPDLVRITLPGNPDAFERLCAALRSTLDPEGSR